jgi:hypothetical protein
LVFFVFGGRRRARKRLSKAYQSGRSGHWLKVKNPDSPAMLRFREG